jgi:DNA-damage-inducible protein J
MANGKSNVSVKIDTDVKEMASFLLKKMGIDVTTAIDMFFRQIITEKQLPFKPSVDMSIDEQLTQAIRKLNPEQVYLETDENGNILINPEKHPDLYDWAVNG